MNSDQLLVLSPIISLSLTALILMIQASIKRDHRIAWWISTLGLLTTLLSIYSASNFSQDVGPLLKVDAWGLWFSALLIFCALITLALSRDIFHTQADTKEEYYLLLILSTLGAVVLVQAAHTASLLLGMELMGIALYAMIAFPKSGDLPLEAAVKYLVLSACASAMLLFGFALLYGATGDLSFAGMGAKAASGYLNNPLLVLAGAAIVLAGMSFKLSLVPFHMWTPDVYQGAPTAVTTFLATLSKGAMFVAMVRLILDGQLYRYESLMNALSVVAVASMLVGNWLALRQQQIKRLIAYSSTAHFGYLLVAIIALPHLGDTQQLGRAAISFYLVAYIVTTLAALTVIANVGGEEDSDMQTFDGLFWRHPAQAITLAVAMLSFAGIPLTAGFMGKFYLITLTLNAQLWLLLGTLMIGSAIAIYYYLRVIFTMSAEPHQFNKGSPTVLGWRNPVALLLMLAVLAIGSWPQPLIDLIGRL